ncbi:MAG: outer membrane protein [Legionellales bacterium]
MLKKTVFIGLGLLVTLGAFAADALFSEELPLVWQPIITVSGGPAWTSPGKDQVIYPINNPPTITQYLADDATEALGTGELFFGLQRLVYPGITGQFGIGLAGAGEASLSGVTTVDGIPDVYGYQYQIEHARVEFKGKLINNYFSSLVQPYLSGSFGVGFNNSHDYSASSVDPILDPAPWFAPHTQVAFSYTLGAGLQAMVTEHWQVGMGYEFADWGKSNLEGNINVTQGLALTHLYTNELLFSLGYVF